MNPAVHSASAVGLWQSTRARPGSVRRPCAGQSGLCLIAFCILLFYWPVAQWTINKFLLSAFHWHWYVAIIAILCSLRGNTHRLQISENTPASVLLLVAVLLEVINRSTLQIQLLSAVLLLLTLHALSGHAINNAHWRASKWPVVVDFGYPLRDFTATVANSVLQLSGFDSVSHQSILLVENNASVVDLDCSGINSLWAGSVFFLLLSWLTRLSTGLRWWGMWLLLVVLLLLSNTLRIVTLVILDLNQQHGFAAIAHTALSAVGFTLAIAIVWMLAGRYANSTPLTDGADTHSLPLRWRWPVLPITALLLLATGVPVTKSEHAVTPNIAITLPESLHPHAIALRDQEARFFKISGAQAHKYQLGPAANGNSIVLVTSNWWKAQHKPDHCLQAMGFSIQNSQLLTLDASGGDIEAVSRLTLLDENNQPYTAVYWFQSATELTADHYRRMVDSLKHPDRQWTMVSLLLRGHMKTAQLLEKIHPIQQVVANSYKDLL